LALVLRMDEIHTARIYFQPVLVARLKDVQNGLGPTS
jgi:hypothetical protein